MTTGPRSATPVVTLFESYGAGASHIGPRVAQALGVTFHAQAFSSEEIEGAMVERENEGLLSQVFNAMGGSYAGLEGPAVAMAQQDNYELVMENTRVVTEHAREGGVITGRNGALILADWPGRAARPAGRPPPAADRAGRRGERHRRRTGGEAPEARGPGARRHVDPAVRLGSARDDALRPHGQHGDDGPGQLRRDHRPGRQGQGRASQRHVTVTDANSTDPCPPQAGIAGHIRAGRREP